MATKDRAKLLATRRRFRERHRDELIMKSRAHYRANSERYSTNAREYRRKFPEKVRAINTAYQRRHRASLRQEVLDSYGRQCKCCGEAEAMFLEIDHINGGGNAHRRALGVKGGLKFYQWLQVQGFPTDRFQLLCANCNKGRMKNGGVCPHKRQQ